MNNYPYLMYSLLDRKIYETIDFRTPGKSLLNPVKLMLSDDWNISVGGYWTQASIRDRNYIHYGWKIHVSTTMDDSHDILLKVLPCIIHNQAPFKFLSDEFILRLSLNKNMPRMQVGKFITIYPQSPEQCRLISEELVKITQCYSGPYILTDRAVEKSKSIYVRFGAHTNNYKLDRYGLRIMGYYDVNGLWKADARHLPSVESKSYWESDLAEIETRTKNIDSIKIGGCYSIKKAIRYHGEGGIYHGIDERTNMPIVVREQRRGMSGLPDRPGIKSGYTIKKEAKLLKISEKTGFTPRYVDHFEEDEHWFLVQERIVESDTLWGYAMEIYYESPTVSGKNIFERIKSLFIHIALGLQSIHSQGIILRDLTRTNVLVTKDGRIKFIDFEFAHMIDDESPWVMGWTPGYGSPQQQNDNMPSVNDDCYAFGVLLLDILTFCASGLELDRASVLRRLCRNLHDLMLPIQLKEVVLKLIDEDPDNRWDLEQAIQALEAITIPELNAPVFPTAGSQQNINANYDDARNLCNEILGGIDEFLKTSATYYRHDRLWPAYPQVWVVNPVCIGYGASGIALYQQKTGILESQTLNWIVERTDPSTCPAGFFAGMAGVAWLFAECDKLPQANKIINQAWEVSSNIGSSLYFGLAGIGLVELKLFQKTGDKKYLARAENCASRIQEESYENEKGIYWITSEKIKLGFAEGQSGIALFFLYLYHATDNAHYLMFGCKALDFDLLQCIDTNGQLLWQQHADALPSEPKTPHLWAGTAGIGAVLLRYYYASKNPKYGSLLNKLEHTLSSRFSNKIWQSEGLAGMIEFHLDMAHFFPERSIKHKSIAWHLAEGIMDHVLTLDTNSFKGLAFAGVDHARICSDYGYGTAGIALCLHRLLHNDNRSLFLDSILYKNRLVGMSGDIYDN